MSGDGVTTTPDERGVRRGVRHLSVVLTADELAHVAQDMAKLAAAAEDAKADVDAIKAENKERIEGAKNREATARADVQRVRRAVRVAARRAPPGAPGAPGSRRRAPRASSRCTDASRS